MCATYNQRNSKHSNNYDHNLVLEFLDSEPCVETLVCQCVCDLQSSSNAFEIRAPCPFIHLSLTRPPPPPRCLQARRPGQQVTLTSECWPPKQQRSSERRNKGSIYRLRAGCGGILVGRVWSAGDCPSLCASPKPAGSLLPAPLAKTVNNDIERFRLLAGRSEPVESTICGMPG